MRFASSPLALCYTAAPLPPIRFCDFQLCAATRTLRRQGRPVNVEPKVFVLLQYLIEHRQRVVPHEELRTLLWPDVRVSSGALTRLVKELRRVLGDDGERQERVRTAFKFGYQFVAELTGPAPGEDDVRTGGLELSAEDTQVRKRVMCG